MDPRLLTLYEQELRYFRESSGEFARAFPKIAHRLGIEGQDVADPYVERLIEATAFLAARVGLKLDAEYPRFTGHLLDIVYPQFMAPTPSMIVVSLAIDPDDANLAGGPTLPRGSGLRARHAVGQNTHCEFRTSRALRVWPVEVQRAQYFTYAPDLPLAQHPQSREIRGGLRIALRATAGLKFNQIALDELLIHFGGAEDVAWQLHECMLGKPLGVLVQPLSAGGVAAGAAAGAVRQLPASAVQPVGFEDDEALLPVTATGFSGHRLVQEYFAFPQRFQFARIVGLQRVLSAMAVSEVELVVLFSRGDAALEKLVSADNVQLHCVPAINLFSKRLDRVTVNEGVSQFHLVPDRTRPQDFEVHTVTEVIGHGNPAGADTTPELAFLPFYAAFHGSRHSHPAYFTTTREPRMPSARQRTEGHRSSHIGSEAYMQIVDPQQAPYAGSLRQLAVSALVTNRDLPLLMPLGRENDFDCIDAFPAQRVRMVRGPSRPVSPVVNHGLGWRVIDHLALNYLSLADSFAQQGAAALREMLMLYAVHGDEVRQGQVRGLLSVRSKPVARRLPLAGPIAFGRGLEVTLEVDRNAFHGHSAFLFGAVMARYLARHVEVNHFVETVLTVAGRGEIMRWRPLCGARPIL
ncbi:type VI secretion system baseplate subunit TssF [Variovorax sp. WS11]|uniref:type VI secretion system baseplate subunit TssF n=1 Tax=Variovorax sp. WS11 TaxID=1105204 RepID=UPI000D0D0A67|nr:type VI secretion system baseplate subunit TssF [Variovorax sp. WS11]NDZ13096.1 type VI secretion system baseplate subunit TssF [Variovorax sp. WS11]PSL83471.1 type VI secretion system baseplate subunit TssF [Variovorax sp. WS11]